MCGARLAGPAGRSDSLGWGTHRLTANARLVAACSSATSLVISSGMRMWAPYEPRPPAWATAAASATDDSPPPNGPWTMGWSRPSSACRRWTPQRAGSCVLIAVLAFWCRGPGRSSGQGKGGLGGGAPAGELRGGLRDPAAKVLGGPQVGLTRRDIGTEVRR